MHYTLRILFLLVLIKLVVESNETAGIILEKVVQVELFRSS